MNDHTPIAVLMPSPLRRGMAIGMFAVLGAMLVVLAVSGQDAQTWARTVLLILGVGAFALGLRLQRATRCGIELSADGSLRETGAEGRDLVQFDQIASVERGTFANKPSHGFVVVCKDRAPAGWAPGLWWRRGRRLAIGGVTPGSAGKAMAEALALMIAQRDAK